MKPAGFWVRLIAHVIDSLLLNAAAWIIEVVVLGFFYLAFRARLGEPGGGMFGYLDAFPALQLQLFNGVIYLLVAFPYFVWSQFRYGTTLGKLPFGIRVVSQADGGRISLRQAMARFAGYLLSYLPLGSGYLMAAFHPEKRALHELVSGTRSVRLAPGRPDVTI